MVVGRCTSGDPDAVCAKLSDEKYGIMARKVFISDNRELRGVLF